MRAVPGLDLESVPQPPADRRDELIGPGRGEGRITPHAVEEDLEALQERHPSEVVELRSIPGRGQQRVDRRRPHVAGRADHDAASGASAP